MNASLQLSRLLQLASPALPVGAYTYSQGLEWAVESGVIRDEEGAGCWIADLLRYGIGRYEAPLVFALMTAWTAADTVDTAHTAHGAHGAHGAHTADVADVADVAAIRRLNAEFLASRESAELRAETVQMGFSLRRLLHDLRDESLAGVSGVVDALPEVAFPTVWAGLAAAWHIEPQPALVAYLWSWAENQVMAALKAVPLGQAAGQRLLAGLGQQTPAIAAGAAGLPETAWSNFTPAFAIACACHETQYSRLFRS